MSEVGVTWGLLFLLHWRFWGTGHEQNVWICYESLWILILIFAGCVAGTFSNKITLRKHSWIFHITMFLRFKCYVSHQVIARLYNRNEAQVAQLEAASRTWARIELSGKPVFCR